MKRLFLVFLMAYGAASLFADDTEIDEIRGRINGLAAEGKYREALPWVDRLLAVRRLSFGEPHPDVARTYITYAQIYERLNQPQEAVRWHEGALAMLEEVAPEKEELAFCLTLFGWYLKDHGQAERAETLLARALAIREKTAPHDPETAQSVRNLAWAVRIRGDLPRAITLFERCAEMRETLRGTDHVETLDIMQDLADTCLLAKDGPRGLALLREVVARQKRASGAQSGALAVRLSRLGLALRDAGQLPAAEEVLRQVLTIREALGIDADTASAWEQISRVQERAKQFDAVITSRLEAFKLYEKAYGPDDERCAGYREALADALNLVGDISGAAKERQWLLAYRRAHPKTDADLLNAITRTGDALSSARSYQEAAALYAEALALTQRIEPANTRRRLEINGHLADCLSDLQQWNQSEALRKEAVSLAEGAFGSKSPETRREVSALAWLYKRTRHFDDAERLLRRVAAETEEALGREHRDTAWALRNVALCLQDRGDLRGARETLEEALAINRRVDGPETENTLEFMANLARVLEDARLYVEAEPLRRTVLEARARAGGNESKAAVSATVDLAKLLDKLEQGVEAEALHRRALAGREKLFGPVSAEAAFSCIDLAVCLKHRRAFAEADQLYQRAYEIRKTVLGPLHETTIANIDDLAGLYGEMPDYLRAIAAYQRELEALTQKFGENHSKLVGCLNNLGAAYFITGRLAEAKGAFSRSLAISEAANSPDGAETADCAYWLGTVLTAAGDFAGAEANYQRALKIMQSAFGAESEKITPALGGLAQLYLQIGDWPRAEERAGAALKIEESLYGPEGKDVAVILVIVAITELQRNEIAGAMEKLERALRIMEKSYGGQHPYLSVALRSLGMCYMKQGRSADAERTWRRSLALTDSMGPESSDSAVGRLYLSILLADRGDFTGAIAMTKEASAIVEHSLGPGSMYRALMSRAMTLFQLMGGQIDGARKTAKNAAATEERMLANLLSFGSEEQRLGFQTQFGPFDILASVEEIPQLAQAVIRRKGIVLDSLLEDRRTARSAKDAAARDLLARMRTNKERLFQLTMEVPIGATPEMMRQRGAERDALMAEVEKQESALARQTSARGLARHALQIATADIQKALGEDTALIEFVCCNTWVNGQTARIYGAIVITHSGDPRWLRLGSATDIEEVVRLFQLSARGKTDTVTLSQKLSSLYEKVWAPIAAVLPPGIKSVVISPDGELNFVPFATLLDADSRFLAERHAIRYVASGRDLIADVPPSPEKTLAIFAAPKFDLNAGAAAQDVASGSAPDAAPGLAAADTRDFRGQKLTPLPGAAREAEALAKAAAEHGWHAESFVGEMATEAQLSMLKAPRILHLATHGFFLAELPRASTAEGLLAAVTAVRAKPQSVQNPMHRSGLALAGAQNTLDAWAGGKAPPPATDGIVTAEEVGSLNLDGTWLVTLSACETGSGEARGGEGVLGLRRGFIQAGAQNLLMTLWPVEDEITVQIMLDFYDRALKTGNAPQALADTQRDWLVKLRKEKGLAKAVTLAGPFIMSSQGKPQ